MTDLPTPQPQAALFELPPREAVERPKRARAPRVVCPVKALLDALPRKRVTINNTPELGYDTRRAVEKACNESSEHRIKPLYLGVPHGDAWDKVPWGIWTMSVRRYGWTLWDVARTGTRPVGQLVITWDLKKRRWFAAWEIAAVTPARHRFGMKREVIRCTSAAEAVRTYREIVRVEDSLGQMEDLLGCPKAREAREGMRKEHENWLRHGDGGMAVQTKRRVAMRWADVAETKEAA